MFKFPNGHVLRYALHGEAEHPAPVNNLKITINAKTTHTEVLELKNWLNVSQTFRVINEQTDAGTVPHYKLTGREYIEVPPKMTKSYRWDIFAFNQGNLDFKVRYNFFVLSQIHNRTYKY